ncbi:hypothetical protein GOB98_22840 [Sinorhizobium meliloti]|nr:hypothetical protein [Sinorhizobium meliloti]MDW9978879.1 hypothetical protein [Sinorhizobium meliloti]MDX0295503.1 hypothetical protein [Sinorhizobium meliloti]
MSERWEGHPDAQAHSISLSLEINVQLPLMEECVTQTVILLREVADRLERGEEMGKSSTKRGAKSGGTIHYLKMLMKSNGADAGETALHASTEIS